MTLSIDSLSPAQPPAEMYRLVPSRGTFLVVLVSLHVIALAYWLYLTVLATELRGMRLSRGARAAAKETREPPPKVHCEYEWALLPKALRRLRLPPTLQKKGSGVEDLDAAILDAQRGRSTVTSSAKSSLA